MASRREFLQVGIAALALPISASAALSPRAAPLESAPDATPLYKVIFDERFAQSIAFGARAQSLGLPVYSIRGDITDLWFHDLDAQWKMSPIAIGGLTAPGALFCLERLAWDHGMRVVFRGDHRFLPGGSIEHTFTGPESVVHRAAGLHDNAENWTASVATLVAHIPTVRSATAKATVRTRAAASAGRASEDLISWVIAPVAGARIIRKA